MERMLSPAPACPPRSRRFVCMALALLAACAGTPAAPPTSGWQMLVVPSTASLRGLAAVDRATAWVTGSGGTVLRTCDGGATWQAVAPPGCQTCDFRDVAASSAQAALVMVAGQPAQVWRTADGGSNWELVLFDPSPDAFFDAIAARGDYVVLYGDPVGPGFYVQESWDGGRTFRRRSASELPQPMQGEAGFAASGTCVHAFGANEFGIVTGGGAVRFVGVRGAERCTVSLPLLQGAQSRGAFSVVFDDAGEHGAVVGGDYQEAARGEGTAAYTRDGGRTWLPAAAMPAGYRSAALWLGEGSVLAVGPQGGSWSGDAGRSWQPFGEVGFHCLGGAPGVVWAAGAGGRVARLMLPQSP